MAEFLLEILCEEIPARMQGRAAADLERLVTSWLNEARLAFSHAKAYATPRRLAIVVDGLPDRQPDVVEERKGPRVGAPDKAIQGFLKSAGLASLEECEVRDTGKGEFYFLSRSVAGRATAEVLGESVEPILRALPWPKSMRWADSRIGYVRPVHSVLAVFDGTPLQATIDLGGSVVLRAGQSTSGHRFLAPEPFEVGAFADYRDRLRAAYVILDPAERRQAIADQAAELAAEAGLAVNEDPSLLDETAGLVEWPHVVTGAIDDVFMDLPDEVLETSMRHHQKYFSCLDREGRLANRFLVVANMPAEPGSARHANIVAGNERVLRARLADARFFWDQDRSRSLASRAPALRDLVFHAKLGTMDEKVDRVQALAVEVARHVPDADVDRVRSAARLAKADLTTGMVGEFPELQGVMGRYYALHDGEHEDVAEAIADHYAPQGPNDRCPSRPVSVAVALADRIDTLVGFWRIGEKPTGSKDPFALRRAALGVIRLVLENGLRVPLWQLFAAADRGHAGAHGEEAKHVPLELLEFIADRLRVVLRDRGIRHDLIAAVFALDSEDDLVRLLARVEALGDFLGTDDGANLLTAYQRAVNIVAIEEKKDEARYDDPVDEAALTEPAERALFDSLGRVRGESAAAIAGEDFRAAMAALSRLRTPVDVFFDQVTVNTEERNLRRNRLRLLSQIRATLSGVADFSRIEG